METTLEEKVNDLTRGIEAIAEALKSRSEYDPKPVVKFSTNVEDYDFSQAEARFDSTVERILDVGPNGLLCKVAFANGKTKLVKAVKRVAARPVDKRQPV